MSLFAADPAVVDEPGSVLYSRGVMATSTASTIVGVDLFCGAGGLSYGLRSAGVSIAAGVDVDDACQFPFEVNVEAPFLPIDVHDVTAEHLRRLWRGAPTRLLAGCAPCRPFSPYRRGMDTSAEAEWPLLAQFGRLVQETLPDLVTMENVPRIRSAQIFLEFVASLERAGYHVSSRSCKGPDFGLAQGRRRLVLMASRLGPLEVPKGEHDGKPARTVRDEIGDMPPLGDDDVDPHDRVHRTRRLSPLNRKRIRASTPGGTWEDWPDELRAECHRRASGSTFRNVYARMEWDQPSPTITTLPFNFGTGRFGHPEQDRTLSLREAAMLQGFPRGYRFVRDDEPVHFNRLGRLIGNAVPPPIGQAIGEAMIDHVNAQSCGS